MRVLFKNMLNGAICGAASAIPGLSGGTTAVILGIYDDLLFKTAHIFKNFKSNIIFIFPFLIGAAAGLYCASVPLGLLCDHYPLAAYSLFFVITSASAYIFAKKALKGKITLKRILFLLSGAVFAIAITVIIKYSSFNIATPLGLFITGFPLAAAIVLPAVSFSYMLLFFGIYEQTLYALNSFDIIYLLPLALGTAIGIITVCKLLSALIEKHRDNTYCVVTGFVFASFYDIIEKIFEILTKN